MTDTSPDTRTQRKLGLTMMIVAWVILFGLMAVYFDDWIGKRNNPNQLPISRHTGDVIEVVLLPNPQHHYIVNGHINGRAVTFLLDTGATDVVVPEQLANQLGLSRGQPRIAITANGQVTVYATLLNSVRIGDIQLADIRASINPAMKEPVVLLGMSALRQIEFSQRGDSLILRQ